MLQEVIEVPRIGTRVMLEGDGVESLRTCKRSVSRPSGMDSQVLTYIVYRALSSARASRVAAAQSTLTSRGGVVMLRWTSLLRKASLKSDVHVSVV